MSWPVGSARCKPNFCNWNLLGERVSGLSGVNPAEVKVKPGSGGLLVQGRSLTLDELDLTLSELDRLTDLRTESLTLIESRLFEQKIKKMMVPTQAPVLAVETGSQFGWRIDPFTGRSALHTGLDYPAEPGTPILAAAGGIVVAQEFHPQYGNIVEVDHGNDLVTRYAHASAVYVRTAISSSGDKKLRQSAVPGAPRVRTCTSRCWFRAFRRIRKNF